jgi:ABC-type transport system substrate-binding protein
MTSTTPTTAATTSIGVVASTTSTGVWWDTLGTPQYGGIITDHLTQDITTWDSYESSNGQGGFAPYLEALWEGDYTVDPSIWDFSTGWIPSQYAAGELVQSYTMPNAYTVICTLRSNVYWQNIAPVNGRQFVASDVVFHYDRMLGLGDGFTTLDPYYAGNANWLSLQSIVPTGNFTVTFNWKQGTSPVEILSVMQAAGADNSIMAPEAIQADTTASTPYIVNWNQAIGTGPFILKDFVDSSSATYVANPNYWGTDLRWPQNKLPYVTEDQLLIIPNAPTAEAAMRVGKLDVYSSMPVNDALNMMKTNPDIVVKQLPQGNELDLAMNLANAPFNNISVRQAIQHAINIPLIASTYYDNYATPWPASLTENQMALGGWGDPYTQWPASVQAQYTYNPTEAEQMLAAAGITTPVTYSLMLETDADQGLYQIVQSELAAVGINLNVTELLPAAWQSQIITSRKYTAFAARNQGLLGVNYDIFHQFVKLTTGYTMDYINLNDSTVNSYYQQALAAQTVAATQQILHDDDLYIASNNFDISVAQPSNFNMVQPWIQGNPGANTLGDAVTGAGFGGGVPIAVWINPALEQ